MPTTRNTNDQKSKDKLTNVITPEAMPPVRTRSSSAPLSGSKFRTESGISAIRDGVKANANSQLPSGRKPPWLKVRIAGGEKYKTVRATVRRH